MPFIGCIISNKGVAPKGLEVRFSSHSESNTVSLDYFTEGIDVRITIFGS
jgi:hypothetical protein